MTSQNYAFLSNNQFFTYAYVAGAGVYTPQTSVSVGDALGDNVSINSTAVIVQNSTTNSILSIGGLVIQNSSASVIANLSSLYLSNGTISTSNTTVNVSITPTQITVTNGSSYTNITSTGITLGGSANLTIGSSVINSTSISTVNVVSNVVTTNTANVVTINSNTINANVASTNTFNVISRLNVNAAIYLGGSNGTPGQFLTSNGTSNAYWSTVTAPSTVGASGSTDVLFNDGGTVANGTSGFVFYKGNTTVVVGPGSTINATAFYGSFIGSFSNGSTVLNSVGLQASVSNTANVFINTRLTLAASVPIYIGTDSGTSSKYLTGGATPAWTSIPTAFSSGTSYSWSASQAFNSGMSWSGGATGDTLNLTTSGSNSAIIASATSGYGISASSTSTAAVIGTTGSGEGVFGQSTGAGFGVYGLSNSSWNGYFSPYASSTSSQGVYSYLNSTGAGYYPFLAQSNISGNTCFVVAATGSASVAGTFSKSSGTFRIDHPLPALKDTHHLVHSFIEGPQADLIYRGTVKLVNGVATINIDNAANMSEGTFVLLCREVQCFTTNESDWDAVRGSVNGNILIIQSQNNVSTSTISWMVIGERQDDHMKHKDTDWTDDNGKPIVENLKTNFWAHNINHHHPK